MTLVERFIEITEWPDSKKVSLLTAALLPVFLLSWGLGVVACEKLGFCNFDVMNRLWMLWNSSLAVVFLVSLVCALRGWNAAWTFYLFSTVMIIFFFWHNQIWGSSSTTFASMSLIYVFLLASLFGVGRAWIIMAMGMAATLYIGWMEASGLLSYAPALAVRTLDIQNQPVWFALNYYGVIGSTAWCLAVTGLAIGARRLQEQRLKRAQALIRRYVPSQVADTIIASGGNVEERHERSKLTIFFSDLVGFTEITEELEPEDLSKLLNEYFFEMTRIAEAHGGMVDELAGDACLIFFGAPNPTTDKDHALRAVRMATDMQQAVQALNTKWRAAGIDVALKVRMGINTGIVTLGNFGSPDRMKYTALGKHVNLAARIQSHCEPGRVLVSHTTWLLVNDQVQCVAKGEQQFKGITRPVMVYEVA